jgi:hypothetical protein
MTLMENRYPGVCFQPKVTLMVADQAGKTGIKTGDILENYKITGDH